MHEPLRDWLVWMLNLFVECRNSNIYCRISICDWDFALYLPMQQELLDSFSGGLGEKTQMATNNVDSLQNPYRI